MATFKEKASRGAERGFNKAEDFIEDMRGAKRRLESQFDDSNIGDRIETVAEQTGRNLRYAYESSADTITEGADAARDMVHRNPLVALAGAFVGGLLISSLLRK